MDLTYLSLWITESEYLFWLAQGTAFLIAAIFFSGRTGDTTPGAS